MITIAIALCLGNLQAQDDPWETHLYNVEFLTRAVQDYPGHSLSLSQDAIGTTISASEISKGLLTGEDLATLIKTNVAEDTWEHVQAKISYEGGVLTITNRKSVHDRIRQYLAYWRGFVGKMITVDALVLSVDPALLAKVRSAGNPDRPLALAPEHLRALLEAAREGKNAELLKTLRVTAHPGQRVNLQELFRQSYIRDHDVQIATAALAFDPIVDVLSSGVSIDIRPYLEPFGNAVTLEVRADRADAEALTERKLRLIREVNLSTLRQETDADGKMKDVADPAKAALRPTDLKVELPRLALERVRTTLTVRSRETAIVGSVFRGGRNLLFLLTPAVISLDDKPAPEPAFEEQRLLRLYDVSPLTRGIQDWAGPRIGLTSPQAGGGGPLTGATFTLEEPVVDLVKTRVAIETWGNKRNQITLGPSGTLMVRQKPEVLREIDQFLSTLLFSRAQMITTEAVLIGFRKGARLDWEKEIPALGPGGYFVDKEKFDRLFEEACKNANVRLVETAEVTGFPQQRVHVVRLRQESIVEDYEPQVSTSAVAFDPIIGIVGGGFVLDARPHFIHGQEQIAVSLRAQSAMHEVRDVEPVAPNGNGLQAARGPEARWESDVLCAKGKWTIVGLQTRGKGEEAEDLILFLRARGNVLAR
jgi:hypothetical protein